jgi:hypothetical protein
MNSALIAAFIAALLVPWVFAVVIILIASRFRRNPGMRRQDFITAIGLTVLMGVNTSLNMWAAHHIPHTIDARLWRWDEALRLDPMAVIYYMEEHGGLYDFIAVIYYSLPLVMAIAWIKEQSFTLRRAVALAGVGGWIVSAIFPAVGPHWYLDGYTVAMRHCIPAVEWSWALLLGLNARSWVRIPLWIYAALLAAASVLLSEHYLVDLIVAVPYTIAVQWAATSGRSFLLNARATATVATSSAAE